MNNRFPRRHHPSAARPRAPSAYQSIRRVTSMIALSAIMLVTRRIDWYALGARAPAAEARECHGKRIFIPGR